MDVNSLCAELQQHHMGKCANQNQNVHAGKEKWYFICELMVVPANEDADSTT